MAKRTTLILLVASILMITLCIVAAGHLVQGGINAVNDIWVENHKVAAARIQVLREFRRAFGYSGFIHHFKNVVIRADQASMARAEESLALAEESLARAGAALDGLRAVAHGEEEAVAVQDLSRVVMEYGEKLHLLERLLRENQRPGVARLDDLVRVDDTAAFEALDILTREYESSGLAARQRAGQELAATRRLMAVISYVLHPLVLLAAVFYLVYAYRLLSALKESNAVFMAAPDVMLISDAEGRILRHNAQAEKVLGYSAEEFERMTIEDLMPGAVRERHGHARRRYIEQTMKPSLAKGGFNEYMGFRCGHEELTALTKEGARLPVKVRLTGYRDNKRLRIIASMRELTEQKRLEHKARTDSLTQLANREAIDAHLAMELKRSDRYGHPFSVIFADIDHFKQVNDTHGHKVGDDVLVAVARILSERVRTTDVVGRWGGEEFLVICPETEMQGAFNLAEAVHRAIEAVPFGEAGKLTASFGVSSLRADEGDKALERMLRRADEALYKAKNNGRNQVRANV